MTPNTSSSPDIPRFGPASTASPTAMLVTPPAMATAVAPPSSRRQAEVGGSTVVSAVSTRYAVSSPAGTLMNGATP